MMIGIKIGGKGDCITISPILSATPAFFTNTASAPPIPVTMIGIAAAVIPSFTQSFNTFLVFHSFPHRSREAMHPLNSAASGLPIKARKFAIPVSGTITDAPVFNRISTNGSTIGSMDLDRDGSGWPSLSSAAFKNSSFGATGVFNVLQ